MSRRIQCAAVVLGGVAVFGLSASARAQPSALPPLTLSASTWESLDLQQRDVVLARYAVEVADKARFARIVNVQGVNESSPGTTAGAELGSLVGQTRYIDTTNWRNYSATNQLAAGVIGALIGAMLDAPARTSYRLVYTLKSADGSVRVTERVSPSPIYVAPGLCVDTSAFTPAADHLCGDGWPPELLSTLGRLPHAASSVAPAAPPVANLPMEQIAPPPFRAPTPAPNALAGETILCKFGPTSAIPTSVEKCLNAGGTVQP